MSNDQQSENESDTQNQGDFRGGTEYPTSHPKELGILERKAIKQRWNIPDKYKEAMVNGQVQIAIDPQSTNRDKTSAFRALLSADQMNQAEELHNPDHGNHPTAAEIAEELAQLQGRHEHGDISPDA